MKKNVKNDKVIKAITIGLAAMMAATSTPIVAFAEEAPADNIDEQENSEQQEAKAASENSEKVVEEVEALPSIVENQTEIEAAQESVNTANEEIHEAETNVDTFVEKVEEYKNEKDSSEFYADQEEKIADKINTVIDNASNDLQDKNKAIDEAVTVEQVEQIVEEAKEALEEAKAECDVLESEFEKAKADYEAASANMDAAYDEAKKAYDEAKTNYENASKELAEAQENLAKAEKAAEEAKNLAKDKQGELAELVKEIYNKLIVVEKTQKDLQELKETNASKYKSRQNEIWSVNDELTPLLVQYDLYSNNKCDPGSLKVYDWVKNNSATKSNYVLATYTVDGELFIKFYDYLPVDKDGNTTNGTDDTVVNFHQIRVVEKPVENLTYNNNPIKSIDSVNDNGTVNITYINAQGKEVKATGKKPVFAEKGEGDITPDGIKNSVKELSDIILKEQKCAKDVENARANVEALKKRIDEIELNNPEDEMAGKSQALDALQSQLKSAQDKLDAALEKKEALDEQLAQLVEKADGKKNDIILASRRNNNQNEASPRTPASPIADDAVFVATPQVNAEAAVAGGANNANAVDIEAANVADDEALVMNLEDDSNILELEDEATPLASFADGDFELGTAKKMSWLWAIIVAIFGTTGIEMYKKHQKKRLVAAAKKKDDEE